jgi:hypothetical protein
VFLLGSGGPTPHIGPRPPRFARFLDHVYKYTHRMTTLNERSVRTKADTYTLQNFCCIHLFNLNWIIISCAYVLIILRGVQFGFYDMRNP